MKLEQIARKECSEAGFDYSDLCFREFHEKPHFEMKTSMKTKEIEIRYNKEYEKIHSDYKAGTIVSDGIKHEVNHHKYPELNGCPRNLENHLELIFEPISEVLIPKGYSAEDCHYISNALEDSILHSDLSRKFPLEGIANFFEDIGDCQGYSGFYEAHVKLNLFLWGSNFQKAQLRKYFKDEKEVEEVLNNFLEKTEINKKQINGIKDRRAIRNFLNDEKNWKNISKIYAEEFSKLMKPNYARSLMSHSGAGTGGREDEDPSDEGNEFDREIKTESFKRGRIQEAYSKGGKKPEWMNRYESLDLLYQSLAKKLVINAQTFTEETRMPISWYGRRPFDPKKDNFKHIKFGFDDEGKLELKKKRWHDEIPVNVKLHEKGFPRSRFGLLDTSGTMSYNPEGGSNTGNKSIIEWGDNSRYHYALLSWYGFIEYLKQNGLLNQTGISLGNFSDETIIGEGLTEAKKTALNPQFGNTKIDYSKINRFFEERGNLVFTISDGIIDNWGSIKDKFIKRAKSHYYFHLQIGPETPTSIDMKKNGLTVEHVKGNEDLVNRTIDLTDKLIRK